ncbi:MAG: LPS export ABC transporter ATP-binding protein [Chlamydiae bacterium]|nr:LPS export ABC transporter ATP-binding protein [Chlamydiota bacterium]
MTLLNVKGLSKEYNGRLVVQNISIEIEPNQIVGLLGPNGAGKTTAFYMIMGLEDPDQGEIFLENRPITNLSIDKRAKLGMGYLAQEPSIFRQMSVEENLLVVLETMKLKKFEKKERLDQLLEEFRLTHLRKKPSPTLSGGERRRLEIARTLIQSPKLLLLDEPFAAIDPVTIDELKELILTLSKKGIGFLITDHNVREIFKIANRCYLVQKGVVTHQGTPEYLCSNREVLDSYLGHQFTI